METRKIMRDKTSFSVVNFVFVARIFLSMIDIHQSNGFTLKIVLLLMNSLKTYLFP